MCLHLSPNADPFAALSDSKCGDGTNESQHDESEHHAVLDSRGGVLVETKFPQLLHGQPPFPVALTVVVRLRCQRAGSSFRTSGKPTSSPPVRQIDVGQILEDFRIESAARLVGLVTDADLSGFGCTVFLISARSDV
jgi:hypothetical protein